MQTTYLLTYIISIHSLRATTLQQREITRVIPNTFNLSYLRLHRLCIINGIIMKFDRNGAISDKHEFPMSLAWITG